MFRRITACSTMTVVTGAPVAAEMTPHRQTDSFVPCKPVASDSADLAAPAEQNSATERRRATKPS
jgi:hypothetical protein